jgi:hypothetical protein
MCRFVLNPFYDISVNLGVLLQQCIDIKGFHLYTTSHSSSRARDKSRLVEAQKYLHLGRTDLPAGLPFSKGLQQAENVLDNTPSVPAFAQYAESKS